MKKVLVVGGGLGGISAAASLAREGFAVELHEKNAHLGGKLNLLRKDGFSFDLGPSILTMPAIFEKLFARAGKRLRDYVELVELDLHWRNFFEDGTVIDLAAGDGRAGGPRSGLTARDREDLERFLAYSRRLYESTARGYFDRGIDSFWEMIRFHGLFSALREFDVFATVHKGVARHVREPHLVNVLDFFIKYVGSSAYDAPAVLNLLPHVQWEFGLWYVKGGLFNLARGLARLLGDIGVAAHLNSEVVALTTRDGRVRGARLADGTERAADLFVCNMEVIPAYERLLGEERRFLRRYDRFEPACSGLVVHLGCDREYPELGHHNFFFSTDQRRHFDAVFRRKVIPEDPTVYVVAATRTDPSQAPPGCENIKLLPHIPHLQDAPVPREDYLALKDRIIAKLERTALPDLRKHIIVEDFWTPEDIQARYYSNRGAIYGVVSDKWKNFGLKAPKHSEKYDNLYFVGGSVNPGGGMPMAALSGQQAADMILRRPDAAR